MKRLLLLALFLIGSLSAMDHCPICPQTTALALKEICAEGICKTLPSKVVEGKELFQICAGEVCKWLPLEEALKAISQHPGALQKYIAQPVGHVISHPLQTAKYAVASGFLLGAIYGVCKLGPIFYGQGKTAHNTRMKKANRAFDDTKAEALGAIESAHDATMNAEADRIAAEKRREEGLQRSRQTLVFENAARSTEAENLLESNLRAIRGAAGSVTASAENTTAMMKSVYARALADRHSRFTSGMGILRRNFRQRDSLFDQHMRKVYDEFGIFVEQIESQDRAARNELARVIDTL